MSKIVGDDRAHFNLIASIHAAIVFVAAVVIATVASNYDCDK